MELHQAVELIHTPHIDWSRPQPWCDLGCGSGTFTLALAQLLAPGSMIHAIDRDHRALAGIPDRYDSVEIRKSVGDLNDTGLSLPKVDGMLIANTLHFIRGQEALLSRLLSVADRILVVEYERFLPNPWGPYPAGFQKLRKLCSRVGLGTVEKIGTRPSRFGGMMYSALAMKK